MHAYHVFICSPWRNWISVLSLNKFSCIFQILTTCESYHIQTPLCFCSSINYVVNVLSHIFESKSFDDVVWFHVESTFHTCFWVCITMWIRCRDIRLSLSDDVVYKFVFKINFSQLQPPQFVMMMNNGLRFK